MVGVIRVQFYKNQELGHFDYREYDYFWAGEAKIGDHAVVRVGQEMKIVQVKEVFKRKTAKATKWALAVFNKDDVRAQIEKAEKREELLQAMTTRIEEVQRLRKLEELAATDTVLAQLLEEFKTL